MEPESWQAAPICWCSCAKGGGKRVWCWTSKPGEGLRVGSAVSCYRICAHPDIARHYPGLIEAISLIGGTQIQGRASLGGNLCNASPAADSIPALIVHRAVCWITGPSGLRRVPVENFCIAPGQTILQPGEFLLAIQIPAPPPHFGAAYLRFTPRNEMDIAVVGVGAAVSLPVVFTGDESQQTFETVHIALGAVAPTPLLATEAGEYLAGRRITPEAINEAAQLAQRAARPISDLRGTAAHRTHLVGVLTRRTLERAIQRAKAEVFTAEERRHG
jgi:CO/xanthine dehydrogenase FAD-binding subunit